MGGRGIQARGARVCGGLGPDGLGSLVSISFLYGPPFVEYSLLPSFFEEVLRIGAPGYIPTDTDIVHMYKNTIGIAETRFSNYAWQR